MKHGSFESNTIALRCDRKQHWWRLSLERILILGAMGTIAIATLSGCGAVPGFSPRPTPVADITRESATGQTLYLRGTVVTIAPFLEGGAYQLQDETGAIWVRTDSELPEMGATVLIKGEIAYESVNMGDLDFGEVYVIEEEILESDG